MPAEAKDIPLREELDLNTAFNTVLTAIQDLGYSFTNVMRDIYSATSEFNSRTADGNFRDDYRTRVILRIDQYDNILKLRIEAQYRQGETWVVGYDKEILGNLEADIKSMVGM